MIKYYDEKNINRFKKFQTKRRVNNMGKNKKITMGELKYRVSEFKKCFINLKIKYILQKCKIERNEFQIQTLENALKRK